MDKYAYVVVTYRESAFGKYFPEVLSGSTFRKYALRIHIPKALSNRVNTCIPMCQCAYRESTFRKYFSSPFHQHVHRDYVVPVLQFVDVQTQLITTALNVTDLQIQPHLEPVVTAHMQCTFGKYFPNARKVLSKCTESTFQIYFPKTHSIHTFQKYLLTRTCESLRNS